MFCGVLETQLEQLDQRPNIKQGRRTKLTNMKALKDGKINTWKNGNMVTWRYGKWEHNRNIQRAEHGYIMKAWFHSTKKIF